jgi:hypothetical protein
MMVMEELLVMVPAVATNIPVVEPLMPTVLGTGNSPLLLLRFTIAVPVGTLVSVRVQVVVWPVPKVAGLQLRPDNCAGPEDATRFSVKLCD